MLGLDLAGLNFRTTGALGGYLWFKKRFEERGVCLAVPSEIVILGSHPRNVFSQAMISLPNLILFDLRSEVVANLEHFNVSQIQRRNVLG